MADAIRASRELSSDACRAAAREHFSARRMTERYVGLYEKIVGRDFAGTAVNTWRASSDPQASSDAL